MKKIILLLLITVSVTKAQTFQWAKQMGGSSIETASASAVDAAGNVYTTGYFQGTVDFDPGPGSAIYTLSATGDDAFITKLDAAGNFVWAKQIGGAGYEEGYSIALDASANVFVTGEFTGTAIDFDPGPGSFTMTSMGSTNNDAFVLKLDANGNFIWAKRLGGFSAERAVGIALDPTGNVYTTGLFMTTADFDPGTATFNLVAAGNADIFISKLDASGNFVWAKRIGSAADEFSRAITVDANSNVYTTGYYSAVTDFDPGAATYTLGFAGTKDIFISKLDASGNFVWAKQIAGPSGEEGRSIKVDASGNVYTTGSFAGTVDFDPGAATYTFVTSGIPADIFVSKLDVNGNFVWAKQIGNTTTSTSEYGNSITLDASNNVYTTGYFVSTCDFDPGPGTYTLFSAGGHDAFVSKLDVNGNFVWAVRMGGPTNDAGTSIVVDAVGFVHTTGYFTGVIDCDPSAGTYTLSAVGSTDMFIQKMGSTLTTGVNELSSDKAINIYPNPNNGEFTLSVPEKGTYAIINSLGQTIQSIEVKEGSQKINVSDLADGIYYVIGKTSKAKIVISK